MTERRRLEQESAAREQIMQKENEERERRNTARREEIKRQEQLLAGRMVRAKTTEIAMDRLPPSGQGIQVYHYKDPGRPLMLYREK